MGICINLLAPPWGVCTNFFEKDKCPTNAGGGGGDAHGWN